MDKSSILSSGVRFFVFFNHKKNTTGTIVGEDTVNILFEKKKVSNSKTRMVLGDEMSKLKF